MDPNPSDVHKNFINSQLNAANININEVTIKNEKKRLEKLIRWKKRRLSKIQACCNNSHPGDDQSEAKLKALREEERRLRDELDQYEVRSREMQSLERAERKWKERNGGYDRDQKLSDSRSGSRLMERVEAMSSTGHGSEASQAGAACESEALALST